jgi:tetratricopeptide (TPR) repeat protein
MTTLMDCDNITDDTLAAVEQMDLKGDVEGGDVGVPSKTSNENENDHFDGDLPPDSEDISEDEGVRSSTGSSDSENDSGTSPDAAEDVLLEGTMLKDEGNGHFKNGDLDKAARAYRRGANVVKKLNKQNSGDDQVKSLLMALQTNLSMICFKQQKYKMSVEVASKAIQVDATNVKALYRRAAARRKIGDHEEARADLKTALQQDPSNIPCKKELLSIKKELETHRDSQKKALAKAFSSSGGSFLYVDKEADDKKKAEEEQRRKKEEQELYKKRKHEWEDECVKRMANNEPAVSFEDWEKEQNSADEKRRKKEEKKRKEVEKRRKAEEKARRDAMKKNQSNDAESDSEDDALTESELAMMRGYKKTKDGRTTSYFTRELSEDEKQKLGDIAPKKLEPSGSSNVPTRLSTSTDGISRPSAWNKAGTWEEKDTTSWCNSQLRSRLEDVTVTSKYNVEILSVEELTGDASVAIAGGKKRYIFDFHAKLKYELTKPDTGDKVASGILRLPDICSTSHEELEVIYDGWTKKPSTHMEKHALVSRNELSEVIRAQIKNWVQDFNEQY